MAFKPITLNTPPEKAAHILAEDDAAFYEALIGEDRVLDIGNKLSATVITNNVVRISDGVVVVGGHIGRIVKGDYEDMTIENGISGKKRNDLICARFISNGSVDTYGLVVIKGAAGATATDPTIVSGNLYNGDKQRDFPLWRICLDGLSITKVEQLFNVNATNKYLAEKATSLQNSFDQLNRNLQMSAMIVDADTNATYPTANMYVNSKTLTAFPVLAICGSALHWISFDLSKATGTLSTTGIVNTPLAGSTGYLTAVAMAQGKTTTRLKFTTNGSYLRLVVPRKEYFSNIVHSAS